MSVTYVLVTFALRNISSMFNLGRPRSTILFGHYASAPANGAMAESGNEAQASEVECEAKIANQSGF